MNERHEPSFEEIQALRMKQAPIIVTDEQIPIDTVLRNRIAIIEQAEQQRQSTEGEQ